jgi:outer membrane lipoprotein LolB
MEGRVAVRRGEDGWQASLVWLQEGGRARIELFDPVGRRVARLEVTPAQVVLTARGREHRARSPEALMQAVLGWSLPVSGMRWWLLGIPEPDGPVADLELDARGRALRFVQSGWALTFKQYDRWDGEWLPARAEFSQAPVRVRLLVTGWTLP